jgi:hypothetical protein
MTDRAATFEYAGCRVRVETTDPAALVWLREFLLPDFAECPDGPPGHLVILQTDADAFDTLRRRGPDASGRSIGCFALDGGIVTLPCWRSEGKEILVFDSEMVSFYRKNPGASCTEIISKPGNLAVRVALLRVVREIVMARVHACGGLVVHGAALEWHGKGYVIPGPKEAGKTTLLLHLLRKTGAAYVANDRSVVWPDRRPATVRGLPTIVNVRTSTLAWFPELEEALQSSGYHHRFSLEDAERNRRTAKRASSSHVTPAQLGRLLGTRRSAELPLGAFIFPRRTGLPGGARLERLAPDKTIGRLVGALFRAGASSLGGEFFTSDRAEPGDRPDAACAALGATIPAFDCALGLDTYGDPASAGHILASVEHEATVPHSP